MHGRVQGVGYRQSMWMEAERLGVTGWVRNRHDGTVEAIVQGEADGVSKIIEWAHRGPPSARVTSVDVCETSGEFDRFEHRPSA